MLVCKINILYHISMKVCTVCGKFKPETDYYFKNKYANKLHSQCKVCYSEKRKLFWEDHYGKYGNGYRKRAMERNKKLKTQTKKLLLSHLANKSCEDCGNDDIRVLEFHHLDPSSKAFSIAKGMANTYSWVKILREIDKCQILCANCHKIKTAEEQGWYKALQKPTKNGIV